MNSKQYGILLGCWIAFYVITSLDGLLTSLLITWPSLDDGAWFWYQTVWATAFVWIIQRYAGLNWVTSSITILEISFIFLNYLAFREWYYGIALSDESIFYAYYQQIQSVINMAELIVLGVGYPRYGVSWRIKFVFGRFSHFLKSGYRPAKPFEVEK